MRFEWDSKKAAANLRKHGVSFDQAARIFNDPFALLVDDRKHSTASETRRWVIAETADSFALVVVFTVRQVGARETIRIISARRAGRRERALYEVNKRVPVS